MNEKHYITAQELLEDSFRLGAKILESGFRPNFIVGIWRGGSPVGIAVHELLDFFGVKSDHISVRTSLYRGIDDREKEVRVHGLGYLVRNLSAEDSLLIVDDVHDTGTTIQSIIEQLKIRTRRNTPHQIRIATPWFKPGKNRTDNIPDYFIHQTEEWLVFPHELSGLTQQEISQKGALYEIMLGIEVPENPLK